MVILLHLMEFWISLKWAKIMEIQIFLTITIEALEIHNIIKTNILQLTSNWSIQEANKTKVIKTSTQVNFLITIKAQEMISKKSKNLVKTLEHNMALLQQVITILLFKETPMEPSQDKDQEILEMHNIAMSWTKEKEITTTLVLKKTSITIELVVEESIIRIKTIKLSMRTRAASLTNKIKTKWMIMKKSSLSMLEKKVAKSLNQMLVHNIIKTNRWIMVKKRKKVKKMERKFKNMKNMKKMKKMVEKSKKQRIWENSWSKLNQYKLHLLRLLENKAIKMKAVKWRKNTV